MNTIEKLKDEVKGIEAKRDQIEINERKENKELFEKELKAILIKGDEVVTGREYVAIQRMREGFNYASEILQINMKMNWDIKIGESLELSCSSRRSESKSELDEIVTMGKVAELLQKRNTIILNAFNKIHSKCSKEVKEIYSEIHKLEKEITTLEKAEELIASNEFTGRLKDGVKFEAEKVNLLPNVQIKRKQVVRNVVGIKLEDTTKSGKSGTLLIKFRSLTLNKKNEEVVNDQELRAERVRLSNLEGLFNHKALVAK